jgi:hypothetical protein
MLRDWLEAAQRRAGLEVMGSLHKLRHTFCSHLAMRGAPPKAIQELAGRESLSTTLRYMHLAERARDQAIAFSTFARLGQRSGQRLDRLQENRGKQAYLSGADENRTRDLLHAMQALSQLSYSPDNLGTTQRRT